MTPVEDKNNRDKDSEIEQQSPTKVTLDYSENDAEKFTKLMTFNAQKNKGGRRLSEASTSKDYTDADKQSFDKLSSFTQKKVTENTFSSNPIKDKKTMQSKNPKDKIPETDSFQYSEQDMERFKKLMTRK